MSIPFRRLAAVIGVALTFGLAFSSITPANAETLRRRGAKTVQILPAAAPAGATVVSASVTVKKGKKTVARNRASYKAKKGTYKVTSTVIFRLPQSYTVLAGDVWASCRVTSKELISDRTDWRDFGGDATGYYFGQVTVRYTGECVDDLYIGGLSQRLTWLTSWSDDELVMTADTTDTSAATRAALVLADTDFKVGDVDYVDGADMSALPPATTVLGEQQILTSTRTVKVK